MSPSVRLAAVLISLTTSACGGTPSRPVPERAPPRLCLSAPVYGTCKLPPYFERAAFEDKLALILNCHAVEVAAIRERDVMLRDCRAWHEARPE